MLKIVFGLLLVSLAASAQPDFVITSRADTVFGEVRILSYDLIDRVQVEVAKKKESYTALQVLAIQKEGILYKPVKYENKIVFMQLLKPGYLSLYAFRIQGQSTYDGRFLVKLNGTSQELPNIAFKKLLSGFLEDCESVSSQIKEGQLTRKDIDSIIDQYNLCMENKTISTLQAKPIEQPVPQVNEKTQAVAEFIKKVEAQEFESKTDALDLLKDIQIRAGKNEPIPNYLTEGLKTYLSKVPVLQDELNSLLTLLKK